MDYDKLQELEKRVQRLEADIYKMRNPEPTGCPARPKTPAEIEAEKSKKIFDDYYKQECYMDGRLFTLQ
jgi:hypothetical protein